MKNYFLLLLLLITSLSVGAQQGVGIGTTMPNSKSILELSSTTKGLLIPRMSSGERTAISSPPQGLMVFQNTGTSLGFWYHDGTMWQRFAKASELTGSSWTIAGVDQYSNVTGNVGIGTMTPTSKLHLAGNLLVDNGTITVNKTNGILQFQEGGVNKAFIQLSGNNVRLGTNSGNGSGLFIVRMNGEEHMTIDTFGRVGIGTGSPDSKLHVYGGTIKVERPGINAFNNTPYTPLVSFEISDENNKSGGLHFSQGGTELANLYFTHKTSSPDFFRFGVSDPDAYDMMINDEGKIGINLVGTSPQPEGQLQVRGAPGVDDIVIQKAEIGGSPTIQFYNTFAGSGMPGEKRAFIQLSSSTDLRMGTNSANDVGKFIIRNNGADRVAVDANGNMGIGTTSPTRKLHVEGNGYFKSNDQALAIDGNNPQIAFYLNGAYKSFIQQYSSKLFIGVNGGKLQLDANQIAIGNVQSTADAFKLAVTGKIICEELKVELVADWPDYVFSDTYHLTPLHELKSFINTNQHLPNIPKASEIQKDGFEVGEMNRKLLEKVEELTLYIIQQQEQIEELRGMMNALKDK